MRTDDVTDKESFIAFVSELTISLKSDSDEVQNITLESYLESITAWIQDSDYDPNVKTQKQFWTEVAKLLYVGKVYE